MSEKRYKHLLGIVNVRYVLLLLGVAGLGFFGHADATSIFLVTELGNLVPLQSDREPQPPDRAGLTPYIHIETAPNSMIVVSDTSTNSYIFRPFSAGITGIPSTADTYLITEDAWDNADVFTFRGNPIGSIIRDDAPKGLYGLPYIQGSYTNIFSTVPVRQNAFTASTGESSAGPSYIKIETSPHNHLAIGSDTGGGRAIVSTDDIDFTTYTGNTATFHIYRSCINECTNLITIGMNSSDLLGTISASAGWDKSVTPSLSARVQQETGAGWSHGGNPMLYEFTHRAPSVRNPATDLTPPTTPTDVSHSDSVWTSKGRLGTITDGFVSAGSGYFTGGLAETYYKSQWCWTHEPCGPVTTYSCDWTYSFNGVTSSGTTNGRCSNHPNYGQPNYGFNTRSTTTNVCAPAHTDCGSYQTHNPPTDNTCGIGTSGCPIGSAYSDCSCDDTIDFCGQTTPPTRDSSCVDYTPVVKALHYGSGTTDTHFKFTIEPDSASCNRGTFPTFNACPKWITDNFNPNPGHVWYGTADITETTQYSILTFPMDIPPGYSTYTINGGSTTQPLYLMIDCYINNKCEAEELYIFASDDIPTEPDDSPFEPRLRLPHMPGNLAVLYDDDRHYAAWDSSSALDLDSTKLAEIGFDSDMLLAGGATVEGTKYPSTRLVFHSSNPAEQSTSPKIFPGHNNPRGELSVRAINALEVQPNHVLDMKNGELLPLSYGSGDTFRMNTLYIAIPFETATEVKDVLLLPEFEPAWLDRSCITIDPARCKFLTDIVNKAALVMHKEDLTFRALVDIEPNPHTYGGTRLVDRSILYVPIVAEAEWVLFKSDDEWRWYRISIMGQPDTGYSQGDTRMTFINSTFHDTDLTQTDFVTDETLLSGRVIMTRDGDQTVDILTSLSASWSSAVVSQTDEATANSVKTDIANARLPANEIHPHLDWLGAGQLRVEPTVVIMSGSNTICGYSGVWCTDLPPITSDITVVDSSWPVADQHKPRYDVTIVNKNVSGSQHDAQVRYFGTASHTTEPVFIPVTIHIPDREAGDVLTIELRVSIYVPQSDGTLAGGSVLAERIIVDVHGGAFGVTVR